MFYRFLAIFYGRNREFFRDRGSLIWNFAFPFLLIFAFGFTLNNSTAMFKVGVLGNEDGYLSKPQLMSVKHIQFIGYQDHKATIEKLRKHQLDLVIQLDERAYWVNRSSPKGYMVEKLLISEDQDYTRSSVEGVPIRYVDWVLPGIISMNIMFGSLFGVGYAIVRYRKNGVLKRLQATPLTAFEFLSAQIASRLILMLFVSMVIFFGTHLLFETLMFGSYLLLFAVYGLGALCLISFGLLIASRTRSEELTGGLLNMLTWPMMGLSGLWFSLEGAPKSIQTLSQFLPLTHLVEATRAITTQGAGFMDIADHLSILTVMLVGFLVIASWLFNWESDVR